MHSAEQMRPPLCWPKLLTTNSSTRKGRPHPLQRNLNDEFVHVDGHDIYKTPSANLAVATNELAWLPQTPEITKVAAMLKAAHC